MYCIVTCGARDNNESRPNNPTPWPHCSWSLRIDGQCRVAHHA